MAAKVAAEVAEVAAEAAAYIPAKVACPFRKGRKELHLPNFTITLCRAKLSPSYAKFHVPLWFSKLDLRDYLYHAYNVRIVSVRSYVKQSRPEQGHSSIPRPQPNQWRRPRANKFMTVELERPFQWPAEPEDFTPWNKAQAELASKERETMQQSMARDADMRFDKTHAEKMRAQAKALLEGGSQWEPSRDKQLWKMISSRAQGAGSHGSGVRPTP